MRQVKKHGHHLFLAGLLVTALLWGYTLFQDTDSTLAFDPPGSSPGSGGGVLLSDTANNIVIGTTTNPGNTRLFIAASSTGASSTYFAIRVVDANATSVFSVRNDGRTVISAFQFPPSASSTRLTVGGGIQSTVGGFIFPDGTVQTTAGGGATLSAANVASGTFGANTGGGNYTFPASIAIGTTTISGAVNLGGAGAVLGFTGSAGGGGSGIAYTDAAGTTRYALHFPGSDVVAVSNRASNGVVQLRANTSTAGSGGEVTSVVVEDDEVQLLPSGGNVGIATTTPAFRLEVLQGSTGSTVYPGINIAEQNTTNRRATLGFGVNGTIANTGWIMGQSFGNNSTKDFYLIDLTAGVTRLAIDTTGMVGIGTFLNTYTNN